MDILNIIKKGEELLVQEERDYLGASMIGSACSRYIWYEYNGFKGEREPRMRMILEVGKSLEHTIIDVLRRGGMQIATWELHCKDHEVPEFQGHLDGIIYKNEDPWAILDIKTCKHSEFTKFEREGLKRWKPVYHSQMTAYMGMTGIHKSFLLAMDKDNCEFHCEEVIYDPIHYEELKIKARDIVAAVEPPERINRNPMYFVCYLCPHKKLCHEPQNT